MTQKLTDEQVRDIRAKAALGVKLTQLEDQFDVSRSLVHKLVHGELRPEAGGLLRGRDYEGRRA